MTAKNEYDVSRQQLAAVLTKDRATLKAHTDGMPPYNSTKLTDEQEAHAYANPDWLYPQSTHPEIYANLPPEFTPEQIKQEIWRRCRIQWKQDLGPEEYIALLNRHVGG